MSEEKDNCQCPICILRRSLESAMESGTVPELPDNTPVLIAKLRVPVVEDIVGFTRLEIEETINNDYSDNPPTFNSIFLKLLFEELDSGMRITRDVVYDIAERVVSSEEFIAAMEFYMEPTENKTLH